MTDIEPSRPREGRMRPPFNLRPVCAAGRESRSADGPYATHYTATASYLYINRLAGEDRFGSVPDGYLVREDLVANGRCHPIQKVPPALRSGDLIWREADAAAADEGPKAVSAIHMVGDLPPDGHRDAWQHLIETYVYRELVALGMIVDWAIHSRAGEGRDPIRPHVHMLATARFWKRNGRHGARHWQWLLTPEQMRAAEEAWLRTTGIRPAI